MDQPPKLTTTIAQTVHERHLDAALWAGTAWLIVTMFGMLIAGLFLVSIIGIPIALLFGAVFVALSPRREGAPRHALASRIPD